MIMKKAQFHSIYSLSIVNNAQIASLRGIKCEIVVFTSACLRSGLNTAKLRSFLIMSNKLTKVVKQVIKLQVMYNLGKAVWTITTTLTY